MFKVLSLNLWFDLKLREARLKALLEVVASRQPSVCCFQEVVPEVAVKLMQSLPSWRSSDPGDGSSVSPYGVMVLVHPDLSADFSFYNLPTNMARRLVVAELDGIAIATVHLESLANHSYREEQLKVCGKVLATYPNAVLVGDFNFDSEQNFAPPHEPLENYALRLIPDFLDMWQALRPSERGLTFDSKTNPYIAKPEQMRYDRVMAKLRIWRATHIELIGHEPLDHLVELSDQEQAWLERPPTPTRPLPRRRDPDLACEVGDKFALDLTGRTPDSQACGMRFDRTTMPTARAESPLRSKKGLFLSDHFGLLTEFAMCS